MLSGAEQHYQRYKAPSGNNSVLIAPPLDKIEARQPCAGVSLAFGDVLLSQLRASARAELLAAAKDYTASYRDLPALPDAEAEVYLTGHQAELFHPGVWFKNFMLSQVAADRGAVGIHLVIDTDVMHRPGIRVPTGTAEAPRVETVPVDAMGDAMPLEERGVVDPQAFTSFGERATQTIAPLVDRPLVGDWWSDVVEAERRTGKLGLAIAQARHRLEGEWAATTLELPMSQVCNLWSFRQFAAVLLLDARRVVEAYNQSLAAYRRAHRLRSDAQPMPDLQADCEWCETPFWVWTADSPTRKPLMARLDVSKLSLSDHDGWRSCVDLPSRDSHHTVVEWLEDLAAVGVKIRTRALTTTLFARMLLSDLFMHGIGGAKYDEVTDDLARRLWGCPPPPYATISATMHLPIQHSHIDSDAAHTIRRQLRQCEWHPEQMLVSPGSPAAKQALTDKQKWIHTAKTPENARVRHQAIEAANRTLRVAVEPERRALEQQQHQSIVAARAEVIIESREYAFCLFPASDLRERMWQLVQN